MINRTLLVAFMATISFCVNAQNQDLLEASANLGSTPVVLGKNYMVKSTYYDNTYLQETISLANEPHPMEKIGKTLTFIGLPLAVIGGVMVSGADALYYECYNGVCDGDPKGGFGIIMLVAGVGLSGTGITLWTIGRAKR